MEDEIIWDEDAPNRKGLVAKLLDITGKEMKQWTSSRSSPGTNSRSPPPLTDFEEFSGPAPSQNDLSTLEPSRAKKVPVETEDKDKIWPEDVFRQKQEEKEFIN